MDTFLQFFPIFFSSSFSLSPSLNKNSKSIFFAQPKKIKMDQNFPKSKQQICLNNTENLQTKKRIRNNTQKEQNYLNYIRILLTFIKKLILLRRSSS